MSEADYRIAVHPRIHVGLISMHTSPRRKNGGVGFALRGPAATITLSPAGEFHILDERSRALHHAEIARLSSTLRSAKATLRLDHATKIVITGDLATHVGMGSGTAIRLACIEGLLALNGADLHPTEIIQLSGRGSTSGIGINTYFQGGLFLDLGVKDDGAEYAPSGVRRANAIPSSLPQLTLPDWEVCLFVPRNIAAKSQPEETEFFARVLPLKPEASYRACYDALFGIYASILEQDPIGFSAAVEGMQETEWKSLEWREYGDPLFVLRDKVRGLGADYVGMSSLGPMLFAGGPKSFRDNAANAANALDCDVFVTRMSNTGRIVEHGL